MRIAIAILFKNESVRIPQLSKSLTDFKQEDIYFFADPPTIKEDLEEITKYFPNSNKKSMNATNDFSEKRNVMYDSFDRSKYDYVLFHDADEHFDSYFIKNIEQILVDGDESISYAFPRINLPNALNYPDFQVRLLKNKEFIEFRGKVHEIPYSNIKDKPLFELQGRYDSDDRLYCKKLKYNILHFTRRTDIKRPWW